MKTQSLTKILIIFSVLLLCVSCKSISNSDADQIVKASIDLAQVYIQAKQYDKAVQTYEKALSQVNDYRLIYNKAYALSLQGYYEYAAQLCKDGFKNYPNVIAFKKAQAYYLRQNGNHNAACDAYLEILQADPYDTDTAEELISYYLELEMQDQAYEQALIMWNKGYKEKKVLETLYQVKPELWVNVYNLVN
ncbi:MAG: hypothetical protein HUK23_05305 [Sphaerochaetaceae bacterium]|nr:hypothetical protein [Sphaerochaetaceae bacterium]